MKICLCGCNQEVKEKGKNYIRGHRPQIFCKCGCGEITKSGNYKSGHIIKNNCMCGCGEKCDGKYIREHYIKYLKLRSGKTYQDIFGIDNAILIKRKQSSNNWKRKNKLILESIKCKFCNVLINIPRKTQQFCDKKCFDSWQKYNYSRWLFTIKGKKIEEIYGDERARDIRQKQSMFRKGKSYEQIFGEEKASEIKQNMKNGHLPFTYEERFGEEKAKQRKDEIGKNVSKAQKGVKESEDTKKKLSKALKGRIFSEEHKQRLSQVLIKRFQENEDYYNKTIYRLSHINKNNPTKLEKILEYILRIKYNNSEIESQYKVGKYIIDFVIKGINMAFEADGTYWHQDKEKDKKRDNWLKLNGWTVIRYDEDYLIKWAKENDIRF